MDDMISRQAALDGIASIAKAKAKSYAQKVMMGRTMFFIEHMPYVSAEKAGRWIVDKKYMECSNCHDVWFFEYNQTDQFKYCPNCGAKMEV